MSVVYLSLGSNCGNRRRTLRGALRYLQFLGDVRAVSSMYRTTPVGVERAPQFLNAVVQLETALGPMTLLHALQAMERKFGRRRDATRWAERVLDLDILLYGNAIVETPRLTIPHPRLTQRLFVLVPLVEIAPQLVLPLSHRTIKECLHSVSDPSQYVERVACLNADVFSGKRVPGKGGNSVA